jgi:hypothetical protein
MSVRPFAHIGLLEGMVLWARREGDRHAGSSGPPPLQRPLRISCTDAPAAAERSGDMSAWESIPLSDRKGRMGVTYVRAVLAQAALPNEETTGGEDHLAVDLNVQFPAAAVRVQVKCGTRTPNKSGSITVPLELAWRDRWCVMKTPVYLVYVRLEKPKPFDWFDHPTLATTVHARAHWVRVNGVSAASVSVPLSNRLSLASFATWNQQVEDCFGEVVSA